MWPRPGPTFNSSGAGTLGQRDRRRQHSVRGTTEIGTHWNGDNPVAELIRELWVYSTQFRKLDHEVGSRDTMHRRATSMSSFFLSV